MFQTGLLNSAGTPIVLPAAFFFGGLVQIIMAVLEISRGPVRSRGVWHLRAVRHRGHVRAEDPARGAAADQIARGRKHVCRQHSSLAADV
jgi:hypothetical protein